MTNNLTERQALGLDESHLADYDGRVKVHRDLLAPLSLLAQRLQARGCQLAVASGYRSFERQLAIFNAKADGQVPVLDDRGQPLALSRLSARETLFAILRFSALPGASRHHWGTDIDVYDKAAVTAGYRLQLVQAEYSRGGIFQRLSEHLPACMGPAGFFRPYRDDCGGVAPEPWHLSYRALAEPYAKALSKELLCDQLSQSDIRLKREILDNMDEIYRRFIAVGEI